MAPRKGMKSKFKSARPPFNHPFHFAASAWSPRIKDKSNSFKETIISAIIKRQKVRRVVAEKMSCLKMIYKR